MSISTTAVGPLALAFAVATAEAQAIQRHFGLGAGITLPTCDYHADAAGEGYPVVWQAMALAEFKLPSGRIGLRVAATYGRNDANTKRRADLIEFGTFGTSVVEKTRLLSGNADLMYVFRSSPVGNPYLLAGIGLHNVKLSITSSPVTMETAFTKVGWNAGGGVRYGVARTTLFLEARYCRVPRILDEGRHPGAAGRPHDRHPVWWRVRPWSRSCPACTSCLTRATSSGRTIRGCPL
jgi:opacity protein-like surface antigen